MAIIAHTDFCGNYSKALEWFHAFCRHLFPVVPDKSTFSRRLTRLLPHMQSIIMNLSIVLQKETAYYLIDSIPVKVCENTRIWTSRILEGEIHRGYIPSKGECFYGLKLHALLNGDGLIREVHLLEGSRHDIEGLKSMSFYGVESKEVTGDRAYMSYMTEDVLLSEGIKLSPLWTKKEGMYEGEWVEYVKRVCRRLAESVFSVVRRFLGMRQYAVSLYR